MTHRTQGFLGGSGTGNWAFLSSNLCFFPLPPHTSAFLLLKVTWGRRLPHFSQASMLYIQLSANAI